MALLASLLRRRDIWKRIATERLVEPLHLNAMSVGVALFGSTRAKIAFDVLVRQQHAFGLLDAADAARERGIDRLTVVELGVGGGTGLLNLCELAKRVSRTADVGFDIVGFDTGVGLPAPVDYRDHPELYKRGWFPADRDALAAALPENARIIFGDLHETVDPFVASLSASAPIGFVTLDVDYHSSATSALRLFLGDPLVYLPAVGLYADDVVGPTHTIFAGELLAMKEFNERSDFRKIDIDRAVVHARVFKHAEWLSHMFRVHVLDHPERSDVGDPQEIIRVANPYLA